MRGRSSKVVSVRVGPELARRLDRYARSIRDKFPGVEGHAAALRSLLSIALEVVEEGRR